MTLNMVLNMLGYYLAVASATGVTAYFTIYRPILKQLKEEGYDLWEFNNPKQTAMVLMFISTIFAPLLLKATIFGASENFIETYIENVLESNEK